MIMKKFVAVSFVVMLATLLSGCMGVSFGGNINIGGVQGNAVQGTGDVISRDIAVDNFDSIIIDGTYNVVYRHAPTNALTVSMHENLFDYLEVSVENGALRVGSSRPFNVNRGQGPNLYVYAPSLSSIDIRGAANAEDWDTVYGERLYITAGGAANIDIPVEVERISIDAAGAVNIVLEGSADYADMTLAGAGYVDASDLQTRESSIVVAGAGGVEIAVSDTLDVVISGAGVVHYIGNPVVTRQIAGIGTVRSSN